MTLYITVFNRILTYCIYNIKQRIRKEMELNVKFEINSTINLKLGLGRNG